MNDRLSKVKTAIKKKGVDAVLVSSVPNIIYLTGFSHFSKIEREAFLFITRNKQYILTDGRYTEAVKNNIKNFELVEISSKHTFEKALKDLAKKHKIKKLGIEENNLTVKEHKTLLSSRLPRLRSGQAAWRDLLHHSLDSQRVIKDRREILAIEKACKLGDKTFKYILKKIKPGVTEKQLAFEIEFFIKKAGAEISFPPIVAFGKNSSIPHHQTSNQQLATSNQFVLLDFGAKVNNYCSDMTRTVFFGKPTDEQKRMYQTVLDAQKRAIKFLKSSIVNHKSIYAKDIDKVARDYIVSKKYKTIPHSVGHGIGLEVHESPRLSPKSKDILKPGMVFTIEPGIYIPGVGGVRIEDVVLLEKAYPRLLTESSRYFPTIS